MSNQQIAAVYFIPIRITRAELARRTGLTVQQQAATEREIERQGYGFRTPDGSTWLYAEPFYRDATWVPPAWLPRAIAATKRRMRRGGT